MAGESERVGFVNGKGTYGSLPKNVRGRRQPSNPRSIHFRQRQLSTRESTRANLLASTRSIFNKDLNVRKVPTLLKDNVRLFTTELISEEGRLYMREDAFYNKKQEPEYALSVSPEIYRKVIDEVNDSHSLPLNLYFCCHGGDAAHSGVADDDYVDIGVAYIIVGTLFVVILVLAAMLPPPVA